MGKSKLGGCFGSPTFLVAAVAALGILLGVGTGAAAIGFHLPPFDLAGDEDELEPIPECGFAFVDGRGSERFTWDAEAEECVLTFHLQGHCGARDVPHVIRVVGMTFTGEETTLLDEDVAWMWDEECAPIEGSLGP